MTVDVDSGAMRWRPVSYSADPARFPTQLETTETCWTMIFLIGLMVSIFRSRQMRLRRMAARARRLFACATARDKRSHLERDAPGGSRGLKRVHSK